MGDYQTYERSTILAALVAGSFASVKAYRDIIHPNWLEVKISKQVLIVFIANLYVVVFWILTFYEENILDTL